MANNIVIPASYPVIEYQRTTESPAGVHTPHVKLAAPDAGAWSASLALTSTSRTVLAAASPGNRRFIRALQAINTGAATVDLVIEDNITARWTLPLPVGVPVIVHFPESLVATVGVAINAKLSAAGTVRVNAQGITAP